MSKSIHSHHPTSPPLRPALHPQDWHPLAPHVVTEWVNRTGRILLTRDRKMLARRDTCALWFVTPNDAAQQFAEVTRHFGIRWACGGAALPDQSACERSHRSLSSVAVSDLMSRCAKCNGLGYDHLTLAELGAEGDASAVPDKVGGKRP